MSSYSPPTEQQKEKGSPAQSKKESQESKKSEGERNISNHSSQDRKPSEEGERSKSRSRSRYRHRRKRRRSRRRSRSRSRSSRSPEIKNTGEVVYINNLDRRIKEKELQELFEKYGEIDKIEIVKDPFTKESRGFAFLTFLTQDASQSAIEALNKTEFQGRTIRVEVGKRKNPRGPTPGRYLGKFRRRRHQRSRSRSHRRRRSRRHMRRSRSRSQGHRRRRYSNSRSRSRRRRY